MFPGRVTLMTLTGVPVPAAPPVLWSPPRGFWPGLPSVPPVPGGGVDSVAGLLTGAPAQVDRPAQPSITAGSARAVRRRAGDPGPGGRHRLVVTVRAGLPAPSARNSRVVGQAVDTRLSSVVVVTPAQRAHPEPQRPDQGQNTHRGLLADRLLTSRTRSGSFFRCSSVNRGTVAVIGHPHDRRRWR